MSENKERLTRREFLRKAGVAGAGLVGLFAFPQIASASPEHPDPEELGLFPGESYAYKILADRLRGFIPTNPEEGLNSWEEWNVIRIIINSTGIPVTNMLEGNKLDKFYGFIGVEQHLRRFPGDHLGLHGELTQEGIAPNLGAFLYFAQSREEFEKEPNLEKLERYYLAIPYMDFENWRALKEKKDLEGILELKEWWRYRKMLVVNPENGRGVVAAVCDAGPAQWTDRQVGGSPEVMQELDICQGRKSGRVLVFFVDDPKNEVPLGPVEEFKSYL